ncbi:hypothetical protein, partial [Borrelia sp. P9F1]|uniref:hypothetical protein n=1 Tax=Borrelia sp. P9F1 TaxID=3058374 RepID=UPI002649466E
NIAIQQEGIKENIKLLKSNIKNNISRIEDSRNKYLSLDYTFKTKKKEYLDDIELAKEENKQFELELANLYEKLNKLTMEYYQVENRVSSNNYLYGIHALIFKSDIASLDKTNIRYVMAYILLLCSLVLDIVFAIFTFNLADKYRDDYLAKLNEIGNYIPKINNSNNIKLNNGNINKIVKKINTRKLDINAVPVDVYKSLDFIVANLEQDSKTIKKVETISKETGKTVYFIRKQIEKLVKHNFVFRQHRNLILNIDLMCSLSSEINSNAGDSMEVSNIKSELKKNCSFVNIFANVSLLTRIWN